MTFMLYMTVLLAGASVTVTADKDAPDRLKCYQCDVVQSNFMCMNEEHLLECEPNMDTCQSIVTYDDVSEKLFITKTCTKKNACETQVNETGVPACDIAAATWSCTTCCHESGCNLNQGTVHYVHYAIQVFNCLFVGFVLNGLLQK